MEKADAGAAVEQSLFRVRPDISIDGKRFIYSSHRGTADQYDNLYVLPVDGGEPYKMTFFSTTRSTRAGRRTANGSPTSRMRAASRVLRCSRPTAAPNATSTSSSGDGNGPWVCVSIQTFDARASS